MSTQSPLAIEFPAVIDAAQAAFLVAAEEQRRAAMRTIGIDQTNLALAVAEGDQVFAEQPHAQRRAIRVPEARSKGSAGCQ